MHPRPRPRRVLAALALLTAGALLAPTATASAAPAAARTAVPAAARAAAPAAAPAAAAPAAETAEAARIDLVLDLSGSMNQNDAGGQTRLAAAKQAVSRIIDTAPAQAPRGLRVYGATYPGQDKKKGCADTQQVLPVAAMDPAARAAAKTRVAGFRAVGFTPIGVSLRAAAKDLGTSGKRRVILVSDGEDTCAPPPPCQVARELKNQGVDLAVDVVGFRTPGAVRTELKCIADVTGGSYADAADADSLTANLGTLFRKEWRTYRASGKPVQGSVNGCQDAPLVTPGQYLDKFTGGRDLFYKVRKRPDQLIQVSATAIAEDGYDRGSIISVSAGPPGGSEPRAWLREFDQSMGWANILSTGGRSTSGSGNESAAPDDTGCIMVGNDVTDAGDKSIPVELLVGIADKTAQGAAPQAPTPRTGADAEGGFSFNSATPIGPGTVRQSITVGEAPFWRVEVKAGQTLTVKAGVDIPADFPSSTTAGWGVTIYNAQRAEAECNKDQDLTVLLAGRTGHIERDCGPWEVTEPARAGNSGTSRYDIPGTYYIQAQLAETADEAKGIVVPISLTVDVTGTPRPESGPVFRFGAAPAAHTPAPSGDAGAGSGPQKNKAAGPMATVEDDTSLVGKVGVPAGAGIAILAIAGVAFYALRRRRTP